MFESMGLDVGATGWQPACIAFFERHLASTDVIGVVVDAPDGNGLAASGVIEFTQSIPSPRVPSGRQSYISTISTDPRWRRRGFAAAVMTELLEQATARAVDIVDLHATEEGRPLYERLGFVDRPGAPALRLALTDPPQAGLATAH
jgi:ribosomal protein S18 acetylase RimI-like enzyme